MLDEIFDLTSKNEEMQPYLWTGKVIESNNDKHPASVRVMIPHRAKGMNETGWARVIMPFAGKKSGIYGLPDVGDEVAVLFVCGEMENPVVIGSLFNSEALPPEEAKSEKNTVKLIRTKEGHILKFDGTKDKEGIELKTAGKNSIKFDDKNKNITVTDGSGKNTVKIDEQGGKIELTADKKVVIKAGSCEISIDGNGKSITIKGGTINLKADQKLSLEGTQVNIKGKTVAVQSDGQLDIKSSGITNIKGSMLKLN